MTLHFVHKSSIVDFARESKVMHHQALQKQKTSNLSMENIKSTKLSSLMLG